MKKIVAKLFKRNNKKSNLLLGITLLLSATVSIYSLLTPTTTTKENNDNSAHIETTFDYKATITPNILYPNGGTVEVENTIFKKITTAIPFNLKTTINSANEVIVKGTHDVQVLINAGDIWKKSFPLKQKQSFEQKGTELSLIDHAYKIDLEKINAFITQVEEETGISPPQYTIEVVPNILGTVNYDGVERDLQVQDKLVFQYSHSEILLTSEKIFTSTIPFTTTEVITSTFNIFGLTLPLIPVRIISSILSLLLVVTILYSNKNFFTKRSGPIPSQIDRINKKYGNRIIQISQKENIDEKSIITLTSFKSILKIADEKELPIFFHKVHHDGRAVYFIVDGDYLYNYETLKIDLVRSTKKEMGSIEVYAKD